MKSLHKSNGTPPDMTSASLTSETYQSVSTITSNGPSSGTTNDVLYIKHSVAVTALDKLESQATNPDIAELANVSHNMFSLNS